MIDDGFSTGKISYSKVRAMTHVANPENEAFLLQIAEYGTANHLKYLVRKYQRCKRLQDSLEDAHWRRHRELAWHQDEAGMYIITSRQRTSARKTTRLLTLKQKQNQQLMLILTMFPLKHSMISFYLVSQGLVT
ncbi:MAG: hypothetical protein ACI8UP_004832 [Porticoccaceae bacterium]